MSRRLRIFAALALVAGLLGALLVGHAAGLRVLWFTSGSMSPTIPAGSVALSHPVDADAIGVGDVLSVVHEGERVTHRAIDVEHGDVTASIVLRGDGNEVPDPAPYLVEAADLVVFAVPPIALGLIALAVAAVVAAVLLARRRRAPDAPRLLPRVAAGTAVGLVAVTGVAVPTSAYWTDGVSATSGTFTTGVVPEVTEISGCENVEFAVALQWQHLGDRFHYRVELWDVGASLLLGDEPVPYDGTAGTVTHIIDHIYLTSVRLDPGGQYSLRVYTVMEGGGSWEAAEYAAMEVSYDPGDDQLRCGWDSSTDVAITAISNDSFPAGMQAQYGADFITNVAAQTISGAGEPGATVVLHRGTQQLGSTTVGAGGTWSIGGVLLAEGAHTYVATATDGAGNTASANQQIVLDTVAPTVTQAAAACGTIGNPVVGVSGATWCRQTSLGWSMTATENAGGSGIAVQQYTNAGSAWTPYTGTVAMAELRGRTMQARAIDVAGNVSAVATGTYYIDGTAPTVSGVYPPSQGQLLGSSLASSITQACGTSNAVACATFVDAISGPGTAQYSLQRTQLGLPLSACFTGTTWSSGTSCNFMAGSITSGGRVLATGTASSAYPTAIALAQNFTVTFRVRDEAGNQSADISSEFFSVLSVG